MAGETNLAALLATMQPVLNPGEYVFCTAPAGAAVPMSAVSGTFREPEGLTLILARETADTYGLAYDVVMAWLTLTVHSSLAAVGLTAAVATALARENISCNVVAAFFHDHLFVTHADADRALRTLVRLASEAAAGL